MQMTEGMKQKIFNLINKWIFDATTGDTTSIEEDVLLRCAKDLLQVVEPERAEEMLKEMERVL